MILSNPLTTTMRIQYMHRQNKYVYTQRRDIQNTTTKYIYFVWRLVDRVYPICRKYITIQSPELYIKYQQNDIYLFGGRYRWIMIASKEYMSILVLIFVMCIGMILVSALIVPARSFAWQRKDETLFLCHPRRIQLWHLFYMILIGKCHVFDEVNLRWTCDTK